MPTRFINSVTSHPKPLALAATGLAAGALVISAVLGSSSGTAAGVASTRHGVVGAEAVGGADGSGGQLASTDAGLSLGGSALRAALAATNRHAVDATAANLDSASTGDTVDSEDQRSITIQVPHSVTITFPGYTPGSAPSVTPPALQGGRPPSVEQHDDGITVRFGSTPTVSSPTVTPGAPGTFTRPRACTDTGTCLP